MAEDIKIGPYNPIEVEEEVLKHWKDKEIYKTAKESLKKKKKFYFLDGPPYTSGKVHIGTAWNKSLKDSFLRFKRMNDVNVWDRAGYDMHGLPIEHKAEEKLNITNKDQIVKLGVDKFVKECRELAIKNMEVMNEDFNRMGVWMDFENAYQSVKSEYIEGEWWLVKKAHENGRLYEGKKTMHWCASCATVLAKHELEYENVEENSIFVKFPIIGNDKEFLIIWTTTPWTIPFNLAVMANPELDYLKCKVDDEVWIAAKALAPIMIRSVAGKDFEVIEELKGKDLEGLQYKHPFEDQIEDYKEIKKDAEKLHTVVMSKEYVDTSAGSGLVHCAPGCGPEDYEVGHKEGLPAYNNLDEKGVFPEEMGEFKGLKAKKDDKKFIEALEKRGVLIATSPVEHDYAHCWRCKSPVIFRTTNQWFFKVEDLVENMKELNKDIKWVPDWAGSRQFHSWLDNLRDNSITKQRFWGTPLPVWKCECGEYEVIGSVDELKVKADSIPDDLHKPWIDEVKLKCKCGRQKTRIPDILDVWVDAGCASWLCLDYPKKKDLFDKMFPADFILEGKDQIRGWFNLLMVASMVSMQKPSFKAVYMHGFVQDAEGRKMSKSEGNYILPEEVIEVHGADTLRYYMIGGALPGIDINYNQDDVKVKHRNLGVLWNLHKFLIDYARTNKIKPDSIKDMKSKFDLPEKYIFSKLANTIIQATDCFEDYKLNETPGIVEELILELSRTYIQLVREKSALGTDEEKQTVFYTIYNVLLESLKLFAPIAPFITEKIFLNLKSEFNLENESIHLYKWPKENKKDLNNDLEESMDTTKSIIQSILAGREKMQLGVRWPVKEVIVITKDDKVKYAIDQLKDTIMIQTNIKDINIKESMEGVSTTIKPNHSKIAPEFGELTPKIIAKLAVESSETITNHLEKDGVHIVNLDKDKVETKKEHYLFEKNIPGGFHNVEFKNGEIYINKERTPELDAEGFAREVMRRVQSLRKKAGMQKTDNVDLVVQGDKELVGMLNNWADQIKEKVGAGSMQISESEPSKDYEQSSEEKVKGKKFKIFFNKL